MVDINGELLIAGVLSSGSTSDSVFGDISWWTGVAPFRSEIESAGGVFVTSVPEPGSAFLFTAFTCFALTLRHRRPL